MLQNCEFSPSLTLFVFRTPYMYIYIQAKYLCEKGNKFLSRFLSYFLFYADECCFLVFLMNLYKLKRESPPTLPCEGTWGHAH